MEMEMVRQPILGRFPLTAGTGSGNYNAVKMKDRIEDLLAQFESRGGI